MNLNESRDVLEKAAVSGDQDAMMLLAIEDALSNPSAATAAKLLPQMPSIERFLREVAGMSEQGPNDKPKQA